MKTCTQTIKLYSIFIDNSIEICNIIISFNSWNYDYDSDVLGQGKYGYEFFDIVW